MLRPLALLLAVLMAVALAGCGGGGGETADADATVAAVREFDFEPDNVSVQAGEVSVALDNRTQQRHTFVIEGREDDLKLSANAGETDAGSIELQPGTYTFYCDVPGHRPAGMEGTLTVG
ncbi:MAG: cupredoxin domain-containing protein [Actinobacteria bacterium]|nr:cupredoxin domain-containing protein [Actinomycetota bacterium]